MKEKIIKILILLATALGINSALAATPITTNFTANTQLNSSCTVGVNDISFGVINPGVTNTTTGTLSVLCTNGTIYHATASGGAGKLMTDPVSGNTISYVLRAPIGTPAVTGFWTSTAQIQGTSTGVTDNFTLTATTTANYPTPGNYAGIITVTLSY